MIFGKSENNGEAAQRWRRLNSLFLYCVLCSLCFLVAVIHRSHRASHNILIETYLQCESFLFLLRSRVQTLWMLTGFASLVVMRINIDPQLPNPWDFHKRLP